MDTLAQLHARRIERWRQTPQQRLTGPDDAVTLIDALGLVTLYPASPEIPNLFHAYAGDPEAKTDSHWDSLSGQVFGWRWTLGRRQVAFYTSLIRKRSTWIRWDLLPSTLRLFGDLRMPDELFDMRVISEGAYRIARALDTAEQPLSTGDLRAAAGFVVGKEQRAAYLKAVEELESRMVLAKVLTPGTDDMSHVLVSAQFRQHLDAADRLSREQALDTLLAAYLPAAVYALPRTLARHLRLSEDELRAGLGRQCALGHAAATTLAGVAGTCYVWCDVASPVIASA
ncbi:MAG: hypothetical protein ACHQ4H_07130 [Ktedonobacterales bacterium]|jgi:hypothetical protein